MTAERNLVYRTFEVHFWFWNIGCFYPREMITQAKPRGAASIIIKKILCDKYYQYDNIDTIVDYNRLSVLSQ